VLDSAACTVMLPMQVATTTSRVVGVICWLETPYPLLLTGKRSLLVHEPDARDSRFILASVSHPHGASNLQEPFWQVRRCPEQPGYLAIVSRFAGCSQATSVLLKCSFIRRSCRQDSSASRLTRPQRQAPQLPKRRPCADGCSAMPGPAHGCCASLHASARQSTFLMRMWQHLRPKEQQTQLSQQASRHQSLHRLLGLRRRH
jgi:hypothetical protein